MRSQNEPHRRDNELPSHVIIRDMILLPQEPTAKKVCGEFTGLSIYMSDELLENSIERLYNSIIDICELAEETHLKENFSDAGNILPLKENDITRVITPEFSFYTVKPLSINQFQVLMQRIADLGKSLPNNLHLVLGSFAVLTPTDKLMNVFAYIQCGQLFQIQLTVKNNPSSIDPVYVKHFEDDKLKPIKNINAKTDQVFDLSIKIDTDVCYFSFQNILICTTFARQKFFSCVEICLDHLLGVGRKYTEFSGKDLPTQISHIIVANTVRVHPTNVLGLLTIADPRWSTYFGFRMEGEAREIPGLPHDLEFGQALKCFITDPSPCVDLAILAQTRMPVRYGIQLLENALSKLQVFVDQDSNEKITLVGELILSDKTTLDTLLAQPIMKYLDITEKDVLKIESHQKLIMHLHGITESIETKAKKSFISHQIKEAKKLLFALGDDIVYRKNYSQIQKEQKLHRPETMFPAATPSSLTSDDTSPTKKRSRK